MFKSKIIIAGLSFVLLLYTAALAQGKGQRSGANHQRKAGKYANQEVSYRQSNTARKFDQSTLPPAGNTQTQLLPYVEQGNLKTARPKPQNLLPYIEQSNLRRHPRKR
ncbi:MAG: hypothetical protein HYR56_20700 [Acidobacteria bacterium]|nr:hypothetical protein [Acidobacteriota bacterium]MBI3423182.1 hypothetical protein [Acidobacteriota bacterium]